MATSVSRTLLLLKGLTVSTCLSIAMFYALVLAVAWAHVFAPSQLFKLVGFHWYMGIVGLSAALAIGLAFGLMYAYLLPRHNTFWTLASSGCVGVVYVAFALASGPRPVWWIPLMEATLLVIILPAVSHLTKRSKHAQSI